MNKRLIAVPTGQLAPYATGFRKALVVSGYSKSAVKKQLNLMVHLDSWLDRDGLDISALAGKEVEDYFLARRAAGYASLLTSRSAGPLVAFLRSVDVIAPHRPVSPSGAVDVMVDRFNDYLRHERGLVEGTVRMYVHVARRFLFCCMGDGPVELGRLSAADVTGFVTTECRSLGVLLFPPDGLGTSVLPSVLAYWKDSPTLPWIRQCCQSLDGIPRCPRRSLLPTWIVCWRVATGVGPSSGGTTPSCCCSPGWASGEVRWCPWSSGTSLAKRADLGERQAQSIGSLAPANRCR